MRVTTSIFALPKRGNSENEYEDAFYPEWQGERVLDRIRVALADGATEGSYSRVWARMLAESFHTSPSLRFDDVFERALRKWERWLSQYLVERQAAGRPILWFEEEKLSRGAFATLLGVRFRSRDREASSGGWSALALGDSCFFHIRGDRLLQAFPIATAGEFDTSPPLVPSNPTDVSTVVTHSTVAKGEWRSGDAFYLATDALSAWFLAETEAGAMPWRTLADIDTEALESFPEWIDGLRTDGVMRNDDVTLTRVDIH